MPPKCKFTKDQIIQAALSIVRTEGIDAITARGLAAKLGTSTRPIFTFYSNMEDLRQDTIMAAKALYSQYAIEGFRSEPPFMGVGIQYLKFAREEPKLFQLLFMTEIPEKFDSLTAMRTYDDCFEDVVHIIQDGFQVNSNTAAKLYRHLWIYTHGIATLLVTKVCNFSDEEIAQMLTEVFVSLMKQEGLSL